MRVLVTGGSGLVGSALIKALRADGHEVSQLVRRAPRSEDEIQWDPSSGALDPAQISAEAVVHLAAENIAEGRWNEQKKARIRDSRVLGTRLLCEVLAKHESPPKVLVCASAIGFYGHRGETKLDETARPGAVLEAVAEENIPIAFLSAGDDLARDLVRATPDVFADLFLRGRAS